MPFPPLVRPTQMFSPPPPQQYSLKNATYHDKPQNHFMDREDENLFSYNNNIMLAAIITLLLIILFVLLLHLYAKWFLDRRRHRTHTSVSVSDVLRSSPSIRLHHHLNTFTNIVYDVPSLSSSASSSSKGLDPKTIALIPLSSYQHGAHDLEKQGLECAICLTMFEEEEVIKSLPKCCHDFHVGCIDMWLQSHSSCPICRAPVVEDRGGSS